MIDLLPLPLWAWAAKSGSGGGLRGDATTHLTPTPATPHPTPPRTGLLRNGNAQGNPNLAPRCGAKNRAGNPCAAPAMPNGRCRLHGGHCTGPRTAQGKAAVIAAHTKHGKHTAPKRAEHRYIRTLIKRNRLKVVALRLWPYLPPDMAARLAQAPDELWAPARPCNLAFVQSTKPPPPTPKHRLTPALPTPAPAPDRPPAPAPGRRARATHPEPRTLAAERQAARAEAAALAPWCEAIAVARAAKRTALATGRAVRAAKRATRQARREARAQQARTQDARAHATDTHAHPARPSTQPSPPPGAPPGTPVTWLPSLNLPWNECSPIERELAYRKAGLRRPFTGQPTHPAATGQKPNSTVPGIDPMNPETSKNPDPAIPRNDPMNPEPGALPDPETSKNPDPAIPRNDPMNPEPGAYSAPNPGTRPPLTDLSPTQAQALRTTTPANNPPPHLAPASQKPNSELPGIDPMNPETGKFPDSAIPRNDPMNPEPAPSEPPRRVRLTHTQAAALNSTTLAQTWQHSDLRAALAQRFGPPLTPR